MRRSSNYRALEKIILTKLIACLDEKKFFPTLKNNNPTNQYATILQLLQNL